MVKNKLEGAQIRRVKVNAENIRGFRGRMFNTQGSESYYILFSLVRSKASQFLKTAFPIQAAGHPREAVDVECKSRS